jgi:sugar phosphate isomerase/epimerase
MAKQLISRRSFLGSALASAPALARAWNWQESARGAGSAAIARFSLAHLTALSCAPPELTHIASRCGYDFVSYRLINMGLANGPRYDLANNAAMLRETRAALSSTGLKLHDIEVARIADDVAVKSYGPALEIGAELGARRVICSVWSVRRDYAVEALMELCEIAGKVGLGISLEFVTWSSVPNLQDALAVRRAVNRPNLGLLIDVLHFNRSRVRPKELNSVPREWFHFAHICDAPPEIPKTTEGLIHTAREARLYPGEGAIDIAAIVNRMPVVPYSLEIPNLDRVKELGYEEHARRCLQGAKKYFNSHRHP